MDYEKYDPTEFLIERKEFTSGKLGQFILGESKLGTTESDAWIPIDFASFSYSCDYSPDDNGTLIFGSESAGVSYSWWEDEPDPGRLYPGDFVRASYKGAQIFFGVVETTGINYSADPSSIEHQAVRKVNFTANLLEYGSLMMGAKVVSWTRLPAETALKRVQRWVKVTGF